MTFKACWGLSMSFMTEVPYTSLSDQVEAQI